MDVDLALIVVSLSLFGIVPTKTDMSCKVFWVGFEVQ